MSDSDVGVAGRIVDIQHQSTYSQLYDALPKIEMSRELGLLETIVPEDYMFCSQELCLLMSVGNMTSR